MTGQDRFQKMFMIGYEIIPKIVQAVFDLQEICSKDKVQMQELYHRHNIFVGSALGFARGHVNLNHNDRSLVSTGTDHFMNVPGRVPGAGFYNLQDVPECHRLGENITQVIYKPKSEQLTYHIFDCSELANSTGKIDLVQISPEHVYESPEECIFQLNLMMPDYVIQPYGMYAGMIAAGIDIEVGVYTFSEASLRTLLYKVQNIVKEEKMRAGFAGAFME